MTPSRNPRAGECSGPWQKHPFQVDLKRGARRERKGKLKLISRRQGSGARGSPASRRAGTRSWRRRRSPSLGSSRASSPGDRRGPLLHGEEKSTFKTFAMIELAIVSDRRRDVDGVPVVSSGQRRVIMVSTETSMEACSQRIQLCKERDIDW